MKTSMTSVTFRKKTIPEIVQLAKLAQLDAVEWGGDIHVPMGDFTAALQARTLCEENGLDISAYGSYYRATPGEDFLPVLQTAQMLQCPAIRVWAGTMGSAECSPLQRQEIVEQLRSAVQLATQAECTVATEYHAWTLTDTLESTLQLLQEVPGLKTFWQPQAGRTLETNLTELGQLKAYVLNLHVFHWDAQFNRFPLADGADLWKQYLHTTVNFNLQSYATLEFVKDDDEVQFLADAKALHKLLNNGM